MTTAAQDILLDIEARLHAIGHSAIIHATAAFYATDPRIIAHHAERAEERLRDLREKIDDAIAGLEAARRPPRAA